MFKKPLSFFLLLPLLFSLLIPSGVKNASASLGIKSPSKVLLDFTTERITKNFEDILTEHEIIKIITKKGIKKYSTLNFPYSKKNQKLKIYYIKIIKPDGSITRINTPGMKTVTAPFNPEAPIFSNQLLKTVTLPGLSKGSILDYKYRVTTLKPYMKNNFFTEDYFGGMSPVYKSVYKLIIPNGVYYRYRQYKLDIKPLIAVGEKNTTITWTVWQRGRLTKERLGPGESIIVPHVMVSSVKSWNDVAAWYQSLTKNQIKPGKNLSVFIKTLIKSKKTELQKIRAIYNFVSKKIRYVGYEFGIEGYKPSNVNTIFKNRFGDCKDHATLFSSMLGQIGVKSYPVFIPTTEIQDMDPGLPTPFTFDHQITAIRLKNGKLTFADTTSNVTSFGDLPPMDQGRNVLIIINGRGVTAKTPVFPPSKNFVSYVEHASLDGYGNISSSSVVSYTGAFDMYERYLYYFTSKRKKTLSVLKKVHEITPYGKLNSFSFENGDSLSKPFILNYSFSAKNYAGMGRGRVIIRIPLAAKTELSKITAPAQRKYSLRFGYNFSMKNTVYLTIPSNYVVVYSPGDVKIRNRMGNFSSSVTLKGNTIIFRSSLSARGYKISPEDYHKARRLFNAAIKSISNQVVACKIK